jgi:hypothetical protein
MANHPFTPGCTEQIVHNATLPVIGMQPSPIPVVAMEIALTIAAQPVQIAIRSTIPQQPAPSVMTKLPVEAISV